MSIPEKDRAVLRDLAKKLVEIAALPVQEERAELWRRMNTMDPVRPMVWCNVAPSCWSEFFNGNNLETTDEWARRQETSLRQQLYHWEHFKDDKVLDGTIASPIAIHDTGWGIREDSTLPDHWYGARRYNTIIEDDGDVEVIKLPQITVDWDATERTYQHLCDVYGDVFAVEKRGRDGFWFSIIDELIKWRGIEVLMVDMADRPEWVHRVLEHMTQGWLGRLDQLGSQNLLSLNNGNQRVGSAALGFTDELPQEDFDGGHVRTIDMWGHATTQIFSEVSPAMHDEFGLTYETRFLERFGLANYGCCEPLHLKVDLIKQRIPNLRRLSMSPWIDAEIGAEAIGRDCIFSWKPNPAILGGEDWFPELARDHIRDTLEKTKGCVVEIIMKDLHTCRGEPERIAEWCEIASELAEEYAV